MTRKTNILLFSSAVFLFAIGFYFLKNQKSEQQTMLDSGKEVVAKYMGIIQHLERHTAGYRPPVSARMFAYVNICSYEVAFPKLKNHIQLPEKILPAAYIITPPDEYNLSLALNAAYAQILKSFFASTPLNQMNNLTELENELKNTNSKGCDEAIKEKSINFGLAVANAIWKYSATDSIGHDAYLYNYDKNYTPPTCKGCWQPVGTYPMPALLPFWANARTFLVDKSEISCRPPITFDEAHNSAFYTEAMEIFLTAQNRSYDDIWIAEFWGDDLPELTVTPVGRWFSITNQCIENKTYTFEQIIDTYLRLGIGLNDASVICWNAKYKYNVERPESYIRRNISANWKPLHDSPSFPAYPSGHATFGSVAVEILKANLGDIETFTDKTHEERPEFRGKPRSFHSFDEMAKENAFSRLPMGVHYRMDCEEGFRMGKVIGKKVAHLTLTNTENL